MKRKLALLLAGCLAITPAAAGFYPVQAFAAETVAETESGVQVPISVSVSDENGTILTEETAQEANAEQYSMTVGDTRQLTAVMEQGEGFPALSTWSSETPEIIDIDDDGVITAKSEGKGLILLSISYDVSQNPTEFKYEIIVNKAEAEISEETTEVTADAAAASAEEIIPEETTAPAEASAASEETAATADTAATAAAITDTTAADTADSTADPAAAATDVTTDAAATDVATTEVTDSTAAATDAATATDAAPDIIPHISPITSQQKDETLSELFFNFTAVRAPLTLLALIA